MNEELTNLLKGRAVSGTSDSSGEKTVTLDDGSSLSLKTAPSSSNSASTGGTIESAELEAGDKPRLTLTLDSGALVMFDLADATGSITIKDAGGTVRFEN